MDVPRVRFGAALEWVIAAGLLLAVAGLGSKFLAELRRVPAMTPVIAESAPPPDVPIGVPPGSVRVPMLLLSSGAEIRVGFSSGEVEGTLDNAWQIGAEAYERIAGGRRLVRRYDDGSTRFAIVLQPSEGREPRVVAIYVAR